MKSRLMSTFTIMFTFILLLLMLTDVAEASLTPASRAVLETASGLGTEGESARLRNELESLPRAKAIAAVREGLSQGGPYSIVAARAANALHLTEVSNDLEKAFVKNEDWTIALALASVANDSQKSHLALVWQSKLTTFETPTRIAILDTLADWGYGLSTEKFDQLLNDESPQVRIATIRNFAVTKNKLPASERIARYKKAFAMNPYQVRLSAMADFLSIPKAERATLAKVLDENFKAACKIETNPDVKTECEKILKGAR